MRTWLIFFGVVLAFAVVNVFLWWGYDDGSDAEQMEEPAVLESIPQIPEEPIVPEEEEEPEPAVVEPEELEDVSALLQRGGEFRELGYLTLAIADFTAATKKEPKNAIAWKERIAAEMALRDYEAAAASAEEAVVLFPRDESFLRLWGEILLQQSKFTEAEALFEQLPASGAKEFYLGLMASYFKKHEEARAHLETAKADAESSDRASILLLAYEEYDLSPGSDQVYRELLITQALNSLSFYEMAVQKAKNDVIKMREDYRDAWIILGHSYLVLEKPMLAKNVLETAYELDPSKPDTTYYLAVAESELGEYEDAIIHLDMAKKNGYEPDFVIMKTLAEVYVEGEYYEEARQEYEKLLRYDGEKPEKYVKLVQISLDYLGDTAYAKQLAQEAMTKFPESPVSKNLLSWALVEHGDYEEARVVLEEIIAAEPEDQAAQFNLGKVYEGEEQLEMALKYYKTAYELSPYSTLAVKAAEHYNAIVKRLQEDE